MIGHPSCRRAPQRARWSWFTLVGLLLGLAPWSAGDASADSVRTLAEYRYFRALSIDLQGRPPTRAELTQFERPDFDLEGWLDRQLAGPGYVERLLRIYMDLLRLEVGPAVSFAPQLTTLHRQLVMGPDFKPIYIYYRKNQRRQREATDGEFCLTPEESGLQLLPNNQTRGVATPIPSAVLEASTVLVRPWWLYRDYQAIAAEQLYRRGWQSPDPLYQPSDELLLDPDKGQAIDVRVCKEEAQIAETGHIYVTGRKPPEKPAKPGPPPGPQGRARPLPLDDGYAKAHPGEELSCHSALSLTMSTECGCGPALEWCLPGTDGGNDPRAFAFPARAPLGLKAPLENVPQSVSAWHRLWWSQEAVQFVSYLFEKDRDFREILTGRYSLVNGPLAQFYRASAPAACCGREKAFGMTQAAEPLFDPKALPGLPISDVSTWKFIPDRGSHAAGILTMPAFLMKFASRRARAALLYSAFLCKSFSAGNMQLQPSTEPNLMRRPGCSSCHATLEPLAAYFSRIEETQWTYLPEWFFPLRNFRCKRGVDGKLPGFCDTFYDPAFSDETAGLLRGAYASIEHAAAGPIGAAFEITSSPEFAQCAVERVTSSLLGRPLSGDDEALVKTLTSDFVKEGYRMRPLIRALVKTDLYKRRSSLRSGAP